jgi:hypothetical protein
MRGSRPPWHMLQILMLCNLRQLTLCKIRKVGAMINACSRTVPELVVTGMALLVHLQWILGIQKGLAHARSLP